MTPVSHGKPCAGNPHARFEEGASAPESPRRNALLHKKIILVATAVVAMAWCPTAYANEGRDTVGWTPLAVDIWALGRTNVNVVAFPSRDWNVAGLSLGGLHFCENRSVYGAQVNLVAGSAKSMYGVQAGLLNHAEEGCAVQSGVINALGGDGLGLQVGVVNGIECNITRYGLDLQAGVFNIMDYCHGAQFGLFNLMNKGGEALQVGFYNGPLVICSGGIHSGGGAQIGVFNYIIRGRYLQIGFLNTAYNSDCFQIGLLNCRNNAVTPLLGWSFK